VRPQLLQRDAEAWRVVFDEETFYLRDSLGIRYLAALLSNPRRKLPAAQLAGMGDALPEEFVATPVLDAWREIAELHKDLEETRAQNDIGRSSHARTALELAQNQLACVIGIGDRDVKRERARKSVRNAIQRAIQSIRRINPALADHLADTIRTGTYCVYRPDPYSRIEWHCDLGVPPQKPMSAPNAA